MAYSFNGSNQRIFGSPTPVNNWPATMFLRVQTSVNNTNVFVFSMSGGGEQQYLQSLGTNESSFFVNTPPIQFTYPNILVTRPVDIWYSLAGMAVSTTSRKVYYYENSVLTNSVTSTVTAPAQTWDISVASIGTGNYSAMKGAEVAVWDVELTQDEFTSLAKGFKPFRVRPQSLRFYAPLIRNVQDIARGLSLTNSNSATVFDHPRVY